ncbi:MAG: CDP-glycerol glycerophosphotransferase family protein, partial [Oscillospiraceae bacterium]|nr:CDP-glycerol glycerophosphotransferase family protein [Oscillospiraceae bacterium]
MRCKTYKMILDLCDSMIEAVEYMINSNNYCLIDDCLSALSIILSKVEENPESLKSETFYQKISGLKNAFNEKSESLYAMVYDFARECKESIAYKIRVLFVAELGGKWDSMASVYYAMKERDDVIVDVVLEPIFRSVKLEDGTERKDIIYKDYLTPMGIEHIPYSKYDIKKVLPDITFISQPYESVTLPMFWPENIAKYSRLVYLPYYSATSLNKDLSPAFDSFFCLNTQEYSWRIVTQSERMKMYYKKYASRHGENVIVTGLPKWDYVSNLTKDKVPCPDEWKNKLSGKKVFLWNTHFNFSMNVYGSRILSEEGMEFLKIFQNDSNIALIWRPHPMTDTIVRVYYPHLLPVLQKLKDVVSQSDNMVLDKYESYEPCFIWSDALISDYSSIVDQYILLDKPILFTFKERDVYSMFKESYNAFGLIDYSDIPYSVCVEETKAFIYDVLNQKDIGKSGRNNVLRDFFALADGCCGKRATEQLINDLKSEIVCNAEENKSRCYCEIMLIGDFDSIKPCIDMCKSNDCSFAICDLFYKDSDSEYIIFGLDELKDYDFECICIVHKTAYEFIHKILIENFGVKEEKILNFWRVYHSTLPLMVCDRVMMNKNKTSYDGVILGLSHTEVGIDTERLDRDFCNLSVSSQDIYFQYQTLKYCLDKYSEKLSGLKYAIIETHDYNYFNFDTSMGHAAYKYLSWGGYNKEPHNFNDNPKLDISFDDALDNIYIIKCNNSSVSELEIWKKYFINIYDFIGYTGFSGNFILKDRTNFVTKEQIL